MHEASVAESILDIVLDEAKKAGAKKILRIDIVTGELSCISADAVKSYFGIISEQTPARGAGLFFKTERAVFQCKSCAQAYHKKNDEFACPYCGGSGTLQKESGRDFFIEKMEVE